MTLQLHCKRSKIFMRHGGDRTEMVQCARGETTPVPDWVRDDPGYKAGLKDKSIVDLTPPKRAVAAESEPEPEPEPEPDAEPTVDEGEGEEGEPEPVVQELTGNPASAVAPRGAKAKGPKGLQGASTVVKTK